MTGTVALTDNWISRFFVAEDRAERRVLLDLPEVWWSRPYEYAWAASFAEPGDTVLDAACGICHPFKFALTDRVRQVYALDTDPRILSALEMLKDIANDFGPEAALSFPTPYIERVRFAQGSITALPFKEQAFDKVFCISVLEHLTQEDLIKAFVEFHRVLRPGGLLVLTFDHPVVNLFLIQACVEQLGFEFAGGVCFELPPNALYSTMWNLHCFRTVLRRKA